MGDIESILGEEPSLCCNSLSRKYHAQLLRKGGEFLTHVWLLIEHLNLKESFQKSNKAILGRSTHGRIGGSDLFVY